ncbi:MAG: TylF/MycF/NovP-related O-methyltransferase [Imperialibacter sp.]|uniref:TylF/MycF/NovP-related O-methyltransferase n=1 Tax=Imperialibacter sp. TaxID=2038411 RepID=UPI0032EF13FA
MLSQKVYVDNLILSENAKKLKGDIVECGVWKGGMIAGISEVLGDSRSYHLFDSFEGLPPAHEKDGQKAVAWQKDNNGPTYFDNCRAELEDAEAAMRLSGRTKVKIHKGWFKDTLKDIPASTGIALLRLDGDWYDSTYTCLESLFDKVVAGGIVILDDYYHWEGCSKAVHDFLSKNDRTEKICMNSSWTAYFIKN